MVCGGRAVRDVAESLGVSQQSLRKWIKQTELDGRERDDGCTAPSAKSCADSAARTPG